MSAAIAIALETEIVASNYDEGTRTCFYTIQRGDKRWTIKVPIDHLNAYKGHRDHKQKRRMHVANLLAQAMNGPHDQ